MTENDNPYAFSVKRHVLLHRYFWVDKPSKVYCRFEIQRSCIWVNFCDHFGYLMQGIARKMSLLNTKNPQPFKGSNRKETTKGDFVH